MSLDTVAEEIKAQAQEEAEQLREEAREEAEQLREEAQAEAEQLREQRLSEVEQTIEQERERELSGAALEAKQLRLEARRDAISDVREAVEAEIAAIDGTQREELTRTLLDATAAEFDEGPVRIYGRADDEELLETLLAEYDDPDLEYAGETDCLGGVVAESDSSRVRVTNTFDAVFEEVWEENLQEISTRLFESDQTQ